MTILDFKRRLYFNTVHVDLALAPSIACASDQLNVGTDMT